MYYFVREGFQETKISEGFCKELTFTGEMLHGEIKIDGLIRQPISIGDKFVLSVDPAYALRNL